VWVLPDVCSDSGPDAGVAVKNGGSKAHIFMRGVFVAEADPQKAKALLRLLIEELPVNGRKEILPTYRLVTPGVCAMSEKVVLKGVLSNPPPLLESLLDHNGPPVEDERTTRPAQGPA
jgi:hypothetical protein